MKHFEFDLTPAKAYDLSLFLQVTGHPVLAFLNTHLLKFYEMSRYEQIQARLEARKGRLVIGSTSVFDTNKVFLLLHDYAKKKNLKKIMIDYQYKPIHNKQKFLEWIRDVVKTSFDLKDDDIAINGEISNASVQVYTNHNIDYFDLITSFNPQYFIYCGVKKAGPSGDELVKVPSIVEHFTSVEFADDFAQFNTRFNHFLESNPLVYDAKGTKNMWLDIASMARKSLNNSNLDNKDVDIQRLLLKLLGIEQI